MVRLWRRLLCCGAVIAVSLAAGVTSAAGQAGASPIAGEYVGMLGQLHLRLHLRVNAKGELAGTLDSLDQGAMDLECGEFAHLGDGLMFAVPSVHGTWKGTVSSDGKTLRGTWDQGTAMALNFVRQSKALTPDTPPAAVFDAAMKPVESPEMEGVMTADLAEALKSGELAPPTGAGMAMGVVEHGVRKVFAVGAAKTDSIFEIGSITKTFTGLVLAQMVEQGKVRLDEPVRSLLPAGTVAKPAGEEIRLVDLATQHSGLPRMPDNFKPADGENPYADYHAKEMYAFLAQKGVGRPATTDYLYSNYGFGLLGQALAVRAGMSYEALLKKVVLEPLGMKETTITLTAAGKERFIAGHTGNHGPAHAWDLDAFAGAGGIRSTAGDLLTYVEAQLHPGKTAVLERALTLSHELRADAFGGQRIALAWHFDPATGNYWHNGATGGYSSYAFFNPQGDYAGVVLLNTTISNNGGSYADRVGQHLSQRLAGTAAISLAK